MYTPFWLWLSPLIKYYHYYHSYLRETFHILVTKLTCNYQVSAGMFDDIVENRTEGTVGQRLDFIIPQIQVLNPGVIGEKSVWKRS